MKICTLKNAGKHNCETVYNETSDGNYIPSYTSEVTTTTYQIDNSLNTTLNLNVIVPLEVSPEDEYIKAVLNAWQNFKQELDSINECFAEEVDEEDCFDVDGCWEDEAEFDSHYQYHHFDDCDWRN